MNGFTYQVNASRTLKKKLGFDLTDEQMMTIWCAVGLAGETGELVDEIKKGILHQHGLDLRKVENEIGDVLWYLAGICTTLGLDLSEIMEENIQKLYIRYPLGFNPDDSINRLDVT